MISTQTIGNKIAEARKKTSISQAQLADKLFISSQAVGKWERGESMPDITTFNRLAEILGVDLNYFSEKFESANTELKNVKEESASDSTKKLSWDMSSGNWVDADFSGLKNLTEKFSSSNMQNCKFIGAHLSGLLLKNNNVEKCDFSNSNISKSQLQGSNLSKNNYTNCLLQDSEFLKSNISDCDFTGANLTNASFKTGNFSKNIITNTIWNKTSFIGMAIDNMIFEGTFNDCYFENCSFYRLTFQNAILNNTFFKNNRNLKRVKFIDCKVDKMTYSFLKSGMANLTGVSLLDN